MEDLTIYLPVRYTRNLILAPRMTGLVALTSTTKEIGGMMRVRLNEAYVLAVRAAGLTPLILPPLDPAEIEHVLDAVGGVILTGGEDVDPKEYGADAGPKTDAPTSRSW